MTLQLYHHGSSACAAKVRFALAEKELPWVGHYVDILAGEQFKPEFLALNPRAVVPVLVHDGAVIVESTVICEYLEESFPAHPIYPRSPLERARVRVWTKAVDEELHPACSAITYVVSHRHTILRNGAGSFEEFLARGANEGTAARTLKWQWIQLGLEAPGAADKIRLYDAYLRKMEQALARIRMARRRALLDGRHRDDAVREPARRARDARVSGSAAVYRASSAGSSACARGRRFGPRSSSGCRLSSRRRCVQNGERSWPAIRALLGVG